MLVADPPESPTELTQVHDMGCNVSESLQHDEDAEHFVVEHSVEPRYVGRYSPGGQPSQRVPAEFGLYYLKYLSAFAQKISISKVTIEWVN